jgi:tRNA (uracil-5-)-methyltransferase TRM9
MVSNREIYNNIAESWYRFRHYTRFNKELTEIAGRWKGGRLLNVGCAHGPDFLPFKGRYELWGLDISAGMIQQAGKYAKKFDLDVHFTVADAGALPYQDGSFDYAIAVATYHHIEKKDNRKKAFSELKRVLKPGSEVFLTVWNRYQKKFWFKGKNIYVPWKTGDKIYRRYYYLFTYWELSRLLRESGFQIVTIFPEDGYTFPVKYFSQNICVIARVD